MEAGVVQLKLMADISNLMQQMQSAERMVKMTSTGMENALGGIKSAALGLGAGLAAGLSINAFKSLLDGTVKAGAGLHDLAIIGSTTVEALSGMASIGKYTDTGADAIVASMNKLTKNLTSATEESAGTGKAIQALGLDMETFRALKPEDQMQVVAKAMEGFQDGAGKSAVAMALYGKEGAKLLPFLKDLANAQELEAKFTTAQAAAADNLDDNLKRISTSSEAWKKTLVMGMIPALDEAAQAYLDVMNGTGGLREEIKRLSADGSIAAWTRSAISGLTYVADMVAVVWRAFKYLGGAIGAYLVAGQQALTGNLSGAAETIRSFGSDMQDMWSEQTLGQRLRARLTEIQAVGQAVETLKPKLNVAGLGLKDKTPGTGRATIDEYAKLIEQIREKTAASAAELTQDMALTDGQKMALKIMEQLRNGKLTLTIAERAGISAALESMLATEQLSDAHKAQIKATKDANDAHVKYLQTLDASNSKLDAEIEAQKRHNAEIGLSKTAVADLVEARDNQRASLIELQAIKQLDRNGDEVTYTLLMREARAIRELSSLKKQGAISEAVVEEAKKADAAWAKFYDSLYNGLTDSLYRAFEKGQGFFQSLWDGIKNLFKTTVLKMVIQGVVGGVAGAAGLPGIANAGNGMGAIGNLNTAAGAAAQFATGASVGASAASLAYANSVGALGGDALGALITANGGWAGVSAGAGAAGAAGAAGSMATIGAAMPYIAAAVLAYSLLAGDSTKPSIEGGYTSGIDPGTNGRAYQNGLYGGQLDANAKQVIDALTATYTDIVKSTGKQAADLTAYQFTGLDQNGHQSAVDMAAYINGNMVYNRYADLGTNKAGMTEAEVQDAVSLATQKSLIAALKSTDLGEQINAYLAGITVEGKTLADMTAVVAKVQELSAALQTTVSSTNAATEATNAATAATQEAAKVATEQAKAIEAANKAQADARANAIDAARTALAKSIAAERDSIQATLDAKAATITALQSVFDLLENNVKDLYTQVAATAAQSTAQANAYIATAVALAKAGGIVADPAALSGAIAASRAGLDATRYASKFESDRSRLVLAAQLKQLQDAAGVQLTETQQAMDIARRQLEALAAVESHTQALVDAANGIATGILSVADAVAALTQALKPTAAPAAAAVFGGTATFGGSGAGGSLAADASPYLYNPADFGGLSADEYQRILKGIIPGFAGGGLHTGGWRLVGEYGPELEATGASRIFNAADTSAILSGSQRPAADGSGDASTQVAALREEQRAQFRALIDYQRRTDKRFDDWDVKGLPATRVTV